MKSYGNSRACACAAFLLAALLAGGIPASGHDGNKNDAAAAGAEPSAGPSGSPTTPKFDPPIPVNHRATGVKLPYFDERGRLQMYFNIQKAFRSDELHLEMKNAFMQTFDAKQTPDANVFMTRCVLDLNTRIVTSDVPVTVRRSDFEIIGQRMVFNTANRIGRMTGHVRMTIYNHQEMGASPKAPSGGTASPSPKTGPTGPTNPTSAVPRPVENF